MCYHVVYFWNVLCTVSMAIVLISTASVEAMLSPSDTCPCRCLCANVCSGKSIELERTFLAKFIPDEIADVSPKRIVDVYYPEFGHAELRLRQNGDSYEITKKIPLQGGSDKIKKMQELTIPLTEAEFSALVISGHRKIVKDRYNVDVGGYQAEVDVFQEKLKGLVMLDFEFPNLEDSMNFVVPDVCLAEVTGEVFKAGGVLAGKSYTDIVSSLDRFDYKPLHLQNE